jgi:hypothetical protein
MLGETAHGSLHVILAQVLHQPLFGLVEHVGHDLPPVESHHVLQDVLNEHQREQVSRLGSLTGRSQPGVHAGHQLLHGLGIGQSDRAFALQQVAVEVIALARLS